jgi:hypothetical protein
MIFHVLPSAVEFVELKIERVGPCSICCILDKDGLIVGLGLLPAAPNWALGGLFTEGTLGLSSGNSVVTSIPICY